ncbi:PhzF family phenazine biosynthesis isomerase [Vitiosangium sp. GDMCC 1.1324]|uniref:PhzF family phenazine biosynthesis isomerase n=1 Tax=Vitiosangium sp. (strain GDMCC 1.1324) TaxID=2138576 RepID=UPI000D3B9A76|nr:PhzF family phenazine biosynthesis isomerase [Vitiosangium sp. GDMCC 1.1324]PTL85936.1 hypothetical protein DAT35_04405 [Vitiosangium sp. GDMCC 1.1324]
MPTTDYVTVDVLRLGNEVEVDLVARCASLDPAVIRTATHLPVFASVGLPFALAEVEGLDALAAARPNLAVFHEAAARHHQEMDFSLFLYVRERQNPWRLRARMFAPLDNVMEDPATGSASGALAAYLASLASEADSQVHVTIEQGVEMRRRSIIEVDVVKVGGAVRDVRITGRCVPVMRGSIDC